MKSLAFVSLIALALVGCGSTEASTSAAAGSGSSTSGGATTTTTGSGSTSSGSSTSTSASSSSGMMGNTTKIVMDSFDIQPGEEVYKCQNFANPFGKDVDIAEFASHMTLGSHHLLVFYKDGATDSGLKNCSGLEFAATPYSTQLPDDAVTYPAGVAAQVPSSVGFRLQSHYLNTTGAVIHAQVEVDLTEAAPGTVKDHAGVLFIVDPNFSIAPNSTQVVKHDCSVPFDMNIIKASSHMHKHGTHFDSTIGGAQVFTTDTWNDPKPATFDPAFNAKGGAPLHYECTFVNNTASTLTFGESAQTNEMCIFVAAFYPVPSGQTTVTCN